MPHASPPRRSPKKMGMPTKEGGDEPKLAEARGALGLRRSGGERRVSAGPHAVSLCGGRIRSAAIQRARSRAEHDGRLRDLHGILRLTPSTPSSGEPAARAGTRPGKIPSLAVGMPRCYVSGMKVRLRADRLLVERGLFSSRAKAQAAIAAG